MCMFDVIGDFRAVSRMLMFCGLHYHGGGVLLILLTAHVLSSGEASRCIFSTLYAAFSHSDLDGTAKHLL